MAFVKKFHSAFRSGAPLTPLGGVWDCAIDGLPFLFDRDNDIFDQGIQSIQVLRQQSDTSAKPGEGSINREDSWRAGQSSWHHGAGQRYRDKDGADLDRFWASLGVNVWTKDQLSLLNDTALVRPSVDPTPSTCVAGDYMYVSDGFRLYRFDGSVYETVDLGGNSADITAIASNGFNVWVTTASTTAYKGTTSSLSFSSWLTGTSYDNVAYVRGRLLVTSGRYIAEVTGTNLETVTNLNASEGNSALRWTAITEGAGAIYASTKSGTRSQIFRITPSQENLSGALSNPVPASPALPTGETISAMYGYLGTVAIGTSKGIRVGEEDGNSNLNVGALIELPEPVLAFDGEGSFVWFGWSGLTVSTAGLGRLDLSQQVDTGVYAYASDLEADDAGKVTSISSYKGRRYFTVQGQGLYAETATQVDSGWLQSGIIRYGIIDDKVARRVELRHAKLAGAVEVGLSVNGNTFTNLGISSLEGTVSPLVAFESTLAAGSTHELQLTLYKGNSGSPVVQSYELRADPVPIRGIYIWVSILLSEKLSQYESRHPLDDYETLVALASARRPITYQLDSKVFDSVTVQDFQFIPKNKTTDKRFENGTMILKLKAEA